jgi:hypothetical protein
VEGELAEYAAGVATGHAEDGVDAGVFEGPDDRLGDRDLGVNKRGCGQGNLLLG